MQTIEDPNGMSWSFSDRERPTSQPQMVSSGAVHNYQPSASACVPLSVCEIGPALYECLKAPFKNFKILFETSPTVQRIRQTEVFMTSPLPLLIFLEYVCESYSQINIMPYLHPRNVYCRFKNIP